MIYADNIIEKNHCVLRNLNTNVANTATGTWSAGSSSYGFYSIPYEKSLIDEHYYYGRATYKFTTTNQSPTWIGYYSQGGSSRIAIINSPVANTEYTLSAVFQPNRGVSYSHTSGTLYNGNSNAISGVTAYAKDVLMYDVTELYSILKARGSVTTVATFKTWCDENLDHKPMHVDYDISALIEDASNKIAIDKGTLVADEFIEADGMEAYSINTTVQNNTYFDTALTFSSYGPDAGKQTFERITDETSPFYPEHPYVVKATTSGNTNARAGGLYCRLDSYANATFVEKFVAKIPIGYSIVSASNGIGTGGIRTVLGNAAGTGNWEEYTIFYQCGTEGTFSTGGHFYITGSDNTQLTWYLAYLNVCDITGKDYLKAYRVLNCADSFNAKYIYSRQFNCRNLIPNGNCATQDTAMLPTGWSYDTEDYAGNAKCSLVQPVNAAAGFYGGEILINPMRRYKVSYWVKCKGDMTSFLTAIYYRAADGTVLTHSLVMYKANTKTQLTAALNPGDTTMTVKSNANWAALSNSFIGFRSSLNASYNSSSSNGNGSAGLIDSIEGSTVINFKVAYTGEAKAINTYVVESFAGSNYPYPIQKSALPTDDTWKYVEGYFGKADTAWDGNNSIGVWGAIPSDAVSMRLQLNIYKNTGTVPIKYSDIKVEVVDGVGGNRQLNKIQVGK